MCAHLQWTCRCLNKEIEIPFSVFIKASQCLLQLFSFPPSTVQDKLRVKLCLNNTGNDGCWDPLAINDDDAF